MRKSLARQVTLLFIAISLIGAAVMVVTLRSRVLWMNGEATLYVAAGGGQFGVGVLRRDPASNALGVPPPGWSRIPLDSTKWWITKSESSSVRWTAGVIGYEEDKLPGIRNSCIVVVLWAPVLLCAVISAVAARSWRRRALIEISHHLCSCGYDLSGVVSAACPECGRVR